MNVVFISPHFPPNFYNFVVAAQQAGLNVFGIADTPFEELGSDLRHALTDYYFVADLHHYGELVRACGYLLINTVRLTVWNHTVNIGWSRTPG